MLRVFKFILFFITAWNSSGYTHTLSQCQQFFKYIPELESFIQKDAYAQWRLWEQLNTLPWGHESFTRSTDAIEVPLALKSLLEVVVQTSADLPEVVRSQFLLSTDVHWPKHPDNTSKKVPFYDAPAIAYLPGHYSASSSIPLEATLRGYSFKGPTSNPNGPLHKPNSEGKLNRYADIKAGFLYSEHIREQNKLVGTDQRLSILLEVLTIAEKKSENGILIRDIRLLDDGHYYLPGFSLPTIGREIARLHGKSYEEFWEKSWAEATGVAKAILLLRYGLNSEMPHLQNFLVQLDRRLIPTGKIVLRDIGDANLVAPILEAYGLDSMFGRARAAYEKVEYGLKIRTGQTLFTLQRSSRNSENSEENSTAISAETYQKWSSLHEQAYTHFIYENLGVEHRIPVGLAGEALNKHIYEFLESSEGQDALKQYRAKLLNDYQP